MDRIQAVYAHTKGRTFALVADAATVAAQILAELGDESDWKNLFAANYPEIPETSMWYLTADTADLPLLVYLGGGTSPVSFGTLTPTHYINDLSQVVVDTACVIAICWGDPR